MTALQETQDRKTIGGVVLTAKQREVLDLIGKGRTNPQIADDLGVSLDGAKWHVSELLTKLGVDTRDEAAAWWRQQHSFAGRLRGLASLATLKWLAVGAGVAAAAVLAGVALVFISNANEDEGQPIEQATVESCLPTVARSVTGPSRAWPPPTIRTDHFIVAWNCPTREFFGSASPVVVGERVYGSFHSGLPNRQGPQGALVAFDANSGLELWRFNTPAVAYPATVAEEVVAVGTGDGTVFGLDAASGTELWSVAFPETPAQVITAGGVIVVADRGLGNGDDDPRWGEIWAIEASTGKVLWTIAGQPEEPSHLTATGDVVVIGTGDASGRGQAVVIEAATGTERWRVATGAIHSPPAVTDELVIVAGFDGTRAYDLVDGSLAWAAPANGGKTRYPTIFGDTVVLAASASMTGTVEGRRLADGQLAWSVETGTCGVGGSAEPVVVGDRLYLQKCGYLWEVTVTTSGALVQRVLRTPGTNFPAVSAGDSFVVVFTSGEMGRFNLPTP